MSWMRKKYIPDLVQLGATFESNYNRLIRLIRMMGDVERIRFSLHNGLAYVGQVHMTLVESCKYTDTFLLEQTAAAGKWVNNPKLTVRLYHDAGVAEVIARDGRQLAQGVNVYPNQKMHLPDEKSQLNTFLSEWLSFCISYGCCDESPFAHKKV